MHLICYYPYYSCLHTFWPFHPYLLLQFIFILASLYHRQWSIQHIYCSNTSSGSGNYTIDRAVITWPGSYTRTIGRYKMLMYTYIVQATNIQPYHSLLPRAHAQGVKQSVCMSVVGVGVVCTKIASLGVLGP